MKALIKFVVTQTLKNSGFRMQNIIEIRELYFGVLDDSD